MRSALLLGLASLLLIAHSSGANAAGSAPAALADIDIPYQKYVLPNGLTLIVHEDHKAPIVAIDVWYHVGSKDERPGRTGFAHLFEHLMFNGSENHNDEFMRPLLAAGATKLNGNTWLDRTTYFENVPVNALDLALWLESDRMGHLVGAIDQKKLDEQRGVVQNEKRQGENRPYGKVDELIAASTYPVGHPYSWTTIGSMEDLNAASLADVKEWFKNYYGAANAVLVIAGDVRPAEVKAKVEHYFGDIAPGPVLKHAQTWVAKMTGEKRSTLQDRVPQARVYKTWNVPGYNTRDSALLQLVANVLAEGKNSRLYKRLVYTDQTATAVSADIGPFEIASQFQVTATVKPGGDPRVVEKAIDEEIVRLLASGTTREELDRIKTADYASFVRAVERIDGAGGKAAILGESELYGGSPDFYKKSLQWMRDASPRDVQGAARAWLSDGVFVLDVQPFPEYHGAASEGDRSKMPAVGTPPALMLPSLARTTLSNGLKVVLAERHAVPVVQMSLLVDAGHAADSLAKPGTSNLTLAMINEGTKTRDALQISARAEALGARISAGSTLDTSYISLNAITSRLTDSLELFSDVLLNPTFPDTELTRLKAQSLAAIQQQKSQPRGIASRLFPRLIYGDGHAYSNPFSGIGTEETVGSMTPDQLRSFYRQWVRPDNATLLIVGDTTLAQIRPLLEQRLSGWKAPAEPLPVKQLGVVSPQAKPRVFLVNRTGSEQSLIMAVELAPPRSDPRNVAFETVNTILGGSFISRINMNLREDKHWSYGAGSSLIDAKGQRPFAASALVQTDKTAESMREMLKELRDLVGARQPSETEIRFAKDTLVRALPGSNETSSEVASSFADILTYGLPDSYLNDFVGEVEALSPSQLQAAASALVHPDALTWFVVGDLSSIEANVRKLDMGTVKVLDADGNVLR
ncbi:MAG: insulinase family protein [Gammaproteobacteria bacterium]|jgi:zinc protease|nr:insulinase family protein [Gammaproteobacteria bacterium]